MPKKKKKSALKRVKSFKKYLFFLLVLFAVALFSALLFFVFWSYVPDTEDIYVSSLNPKQGDTILIETDGQLPKVSGSFDDKTLAFFHSKDNSIWIAYLGIDADIKPGKYKLYVSVPGKVIEKEINVISSNFQGTEIAAPSLENKGYTEKVAINNIIKKDNPPLSEIIKTFTPTAYFDGPFAYPLKEVKKSGFDFGGFIKLGSFLIQHLGIDLKAPEGTEIYAINNGKVVFEKNLTNYGKTIVIDHGLGIFSLYLHMDKFDVEQGQDVKKGDVIGLSGSTGYAAGPHLHFSIRDNGSRIDPLVFIKSTQEMPSNYNLGRVKKLFLSWLNIK
jgi:murein DD-endopeptidase MepM/ murein hydrolase activator NlpD